MEPSTFSSKRPEGVFGERDTPTDTETTTAGGTGSAAEKDSDSFTLHGIMLQPGVFGEGGPSSSTSEIKRRKKTIGTLSKQRFVTFYSDKNTGEVNPCLLQLRSLFLAELTNVEQYQQITYLDLTYNKITNTGLAVLPQLVNLVTLILDHNKIRSMTLPKMRNLMYLSLNNNILTVMSHINQPNLQFLYLNENRIKFVGFVDTAPKLNTLSISHCKLISMSADYTHTLEKLYLSYNSISNIQGLHSLVNLKWLHLRGNNIKKLTGLSEELKKLYYVNLRENEITEVVQLKYLRKLPMLRILIITGNPINEEKEIRLKILIQSFNMRRINKYLVDDEEVEIAKILKEKTAEQEKEEEKMRDLEGEG